MQIIRGLLLRRLLIRYHQRLLRDFLKWLLRLLRYYVILILVFAEYVMQTGFDFTPVSLPLFGREDGRTVLNADRAAAKRDYFYLVIAFFHDYYTIFPGECLLFYVDDPYFIGFAVVLEVRNLK